MSIYNALKKDHRKVLSLVDQLIESSERNPEEWGSLVARIRDELIPHSRAEEALFYNPIGETEHGKGRVNHSYREHALAEAELRTLQAMDKIDAHWTALAKKLRDDLGRHIEEEETEVFAAAKVIFSDQEADQIGAAFEQLKPFVKEQSFTGTTLDLVTNLLPKRLVESFRKRFASRKDAAA